MPRKATAKNAADDDMRSNLTPELALDKHMPAIRSAKRDHEALVEEASKAASIYRSALKAAKKDGCDSDTIAFMLGFEKKENADQQRFVQSFNRIAMYMELPLGTQMGLLDGKTIATAVEDKKIEDGKNGDEDVEFDPPGSTAGTNVADAQAYNDGEKASREGKALDLCPHKGTSPKAKALRAHWERGWADDTAARVEQMGKKPGGHEAGHA